MDKPCDSSNSSQGAHVTIFILFQFAAKRRENRIETNPKRNESTEWNRLLLMRWGVAYLCTDLSHFLLGNFIHVLDQISVTGKLEPAEFGFSHRKMYLRTMCLLKFRRVDIFLFLSCAEKRAQLFVYPIRRWWTHCEDPFRFVFFFLFQNSNDPRKTNEMRVFQSQIHEIQFRNRCSHSGLERDLL